MKVLTFDEWVEDRHEDCDCKIFNIDPLCDLCSGEGVLGEDGLPYDEYIHEDMIDCICLQNGPYEIVAKDDCLVCNGTGNALRSNGNGSSSISV